MNQREPTPAPLGAGQALPCLALLLLSLLAVVRAWSRPAHHPQSAFGHAKPYLVALGAPPLRFQELEPPPDLVTRPPAAAPPQPAAAAGSEPAPSDNPQPVSSPSSVVTASPVAPVAPASSVTTNDATTDLLPPESEPPPVRTPAPILPDDLRPQARPEDFLPFFRIPVSRPGDPTVIVPVPRTPANPASPAPLPPSSATYTQSP